MNKVSKSDAGKGKKYENIIPPEKKSRPAR